MTINPDCLDQHAPIVRDALLSTVEELAAGGATAEELEHEREQASRGLAEREIEHQLDSAATSELLGAEHWSDERILRELEVLTADDVAGAARTVAASAILLVPEGTPMPSGGRLVKLGSWEHTAVDGRSFAPVKRGLRLRRRPADLVVVGDEGVSWVPAGADGEVVTVRFDRCVAVMREPRDAVRLLGDDDASVYFEPKKLQQGDEALALVIARMPADRFFDSVALEHFRRVRELSRGGSSPLIGAELDALLDVLGDGERLLQLGRATVDRASVPLALTDHRLLFLRELASSDWEAISYAALTDVGVRGVGMLELATADATYTLETEPADDAAVLATMIRTHTEELGMSGGERSHERLF